MRRLVALGVVLVAFAVPVGAAQWLHVLSGVTSTVKFEQLADNHLRLGGDVRIELGTWKIRADEVDILSDESRLVATGNVVITSEGGRIEAERVELDLESETGTFYNATFGGANP